MRWLLILAVAFRLVAAAVLIGGPWTDQPGELAGWDVARFQQLADEPGRPWIDHPVEYPPGSVLIIDGLARSNVVGTHRLLTGLSLLVDLGLGALIWQLAGRRAATAYFLLGLPLVPMGLLRLDLWAAASAALAVAALSRRRSGLFGLLAAAAAFIKIWPALLVPAAAGARQRRAVMAAAAALATGGVAWLAYGGFSLDPVNQVVSLRGATGWHLESIPGSLAALLSDDQPQRQLDAFRIGHLDHRLVLAGQVVTVAVTLTLAALAWSAARLRDRSAAASADLASSCDPGVTELTGTGLTDSDEDQEIVGTMALTMLGATAALIVTAPLLSPQFLLWLTPWAALLLAGDGRAATWRWRLAALTGTATAVTGLVLLIFGPPNLGRPLPALLLLGRDAALVAVVVFALLAARTLAIGTGPSLSPSPDRTAGQAERKTRWGRAAPDQAPLVRSRRSTR